MAGHGLWQDELKGPYRGSWSAHPKVISKTAHGQLTAVSGSYGYLVRVTRSQGTVIPRGSLHLVSRIQVNPRSLPAVQPGETNLLYSSGPEVERIVIPAEIKRTQLCSLAVSNESGQELLHPNDSDAGEVIYLLDAGGRELSGFDAGARFMDLSDGLAPDKLTAETRKTVIRTQPGDASLEWSTSLDGPFHQLWSFPRKLTWRDGDPINRLLVWPETLQQVRSLPAGTKRVYVRLKSSGPAIDHPRLAVYVKSAPPKGNLQILQIWSENGVRREHLERIPAALKEHNFTIHAGARPENEAVIFSAN